MAAQTNSAEYHKTINKIKQYSCGTTLQDKCNELTLQQLHKIAGRAA